MVAGGRRVPRVLVSLSSFCKSDREIRAAMFETLRQGDQLVASLYKEVLELRHALVLLEDVARGLEKKNAGLREELKLERGPHSVLYERALARRVGRHPGGDA